MMTATSTAMCCGIAAVALSAALFGAGGGARGAGGGDAAAIQAGLSTEVIESPAGEYSTQPSLSVDRSGNVYLIWIQRAPGQNAAVKFSRYDGSRWTEPGSIASERGIIVNNADIPSLIPLSGGALAAHWLQSGAGSRGYGVRVAYSADGGATWRPPVVPHAGHETGENGFVSLFAAGDTAGVVWLDGRNFSGTAGTARNQTMLMSARVDRNGSVSGESVLDDRVCDCCQTAFAITTRGALLAYRDRSTEEIRDISVIQFQNGRWSTPRAVHNDGWMIRSCPVNGPSVAALGDVVALGWFTAARDTSKVLLSFSSDAGARFSAPVRVDAGDPRGRVAVVLSDSNTAWISWVERTGGATSELRLRRVSRSGSLSPVFTVNAPQGTHTPGFPQMVIRRGELYLAWTTAAQPGIPATVQVARGRISAR